MNALFSNICRESGVIEDDTGDFDIFPEGKVRQSVLSKMKGKFFIRPFPSCSKPLFQSDAKGETIAIKMIFHSHAKETHYHEKGFALSRVSKVRFLELGNGLFISLLVFFSFYLAFQVLNVLNYFVRNFVTTCLLFEFVENAMKRINQHICKSYQILCNV